MRRDPMVLIAGFRTRDGLPSVSNELLVDLAPTFAKAEPETVHLHLDIEEQQLLCEGFLQHDPWREHSASA